MLTSTPRPVEVGRCGDVGGRGVAGAIGWTEAREGWGGGRLEGGGQGGRGHERGMGRRWREVCRLVWVSGWWVRGGVKVCRHEGGVRGEMGAYDST